MAHIPQSSGTDKPSHDGQRSPLKILNSVIRAVQRSSIIVDKRVAILRTATRRGLIANMSDYWEDIGDSGLRRKFFPIPLPLLSNKRDSATMGLSTTSAHWWKLPNEGFLASPSSSSGTWACVIRMCWRPRYMHPWLLVHWTNVTTKYRGQISSFSSWII